jgi:hypothetical protein
MATQLLPPCPVIICIHHLKPPVTYITIRILHLILIIICHRNRVLFHLIMGSNLYPPKSSISLHLLITASQLRPNQTYDPKQHLPMALTVP